MSSFFATPHRLICHSILPHVKIGSHANPDNNSEYGKPTLRHKSWSSSKFCGSEESCQFLGYWID